MARPSVRNQIVEAGLKVFSKRGYSATSVQDITSAAEVPKGSFYNHFKSKEALGAEIVDLYGLGSTRREILSDTSISPATRLKRHFTALNEHYGSCGNGCLVGKFMADVSETSPLIRGHLLAVVNRWTGELAVAIRDGQADGTITNTIEPRELAAFLVDAYEGTILRARLERDDRAFKAFMRILRSTLLR